MYRNRVEICSVFALLFIFSSLAAAVYRLGGGVLPHAHPYVFNVLLLLVLSICPSFVSLGCEHCRWVCQSDYIVQSCLICLKKKDRQISREINILIYNSKSCNILTSWWRSDHIKQHESTSCWLQTWLMSGLFCWSCVFWTIRVGTATSYHLSNKKREIIMVVATNDKICFFVSYQNISGQGLFWLLQLF